MTTLQPQDLQASPAKLAHIVFKTRDKARMLQWYRQVLNARIVFDSSFIGFLSYDDEHHRVAVIESPEFDAPAPAAAGLHHTAFTYDTLAQLLGTYVRLRDSGIRPAHAINHGPTTSIYYVDPDGNRVELQIDNFASVAEGQAWFESPAFSENPIGVDFDPEMLLQRFQAGEPEAALKLRPNIGPRGLPRR